MMLQIRRSYSHSIDEVINRFATTAARIFNFLQRNRQILKYKHFKLIISVGPEIFYWSFTYHSSILATPDF